MLLFPSPRAPSVSFFFDVAQQTEEKKCERRAPRKKRTNENTSQRRTLEPRTAWNYVVGMVLRMLRTEEREEGSEPTGFPRKFQLGCDFAACKQLLYLPLEYLRGLACASFSAYHIKETPC
jgi:hypothetical protein